MYRDQFSRSVVSDSLWPHGLQHSRLPCPSQPCLTQWNYEPCHVGPPKIDGSWWRVLTKHHWSQGNGNGPLEKGMANHFSVLALRAPSTVMYRDTHTVWSGHSRWLFSCLVYIPCPTSACFTCTLLTWLTFLHTCPRTQLVIAYQTGGEGHASLLVSLVTNDKWSRSVGSNSLRPHGL